jgi:hypothetical protein
MDWIDLAQDRDQSRALGNQVINFRGSIKYCEMTPECRNSGPEETSIARQRLGKQVSAATNMQATIEKLKCCDDDILVQILHFWTLSSSCLYFKIRSRDWILSRSSDKTYSLGPTE